MKLQTRVVLIFVIIFFLVTALVGVILPSAIHEQTLKSATESSSLQISLIDHSISSFISSAKNHVLELSQNPAVRDRDDSGFTNYLSADEETFILKPDKKEQEITAILNNYRTTNPYVNSVYMGRENGAFVRSHPRANNTAYDPRDRPWYILAEENPDSVVITGPYRSVTTPDMNIGVVKALVDENGTFYGVVGADITLEGISDFISGIDPEGSSQLIISDENGIILTSSDESQNYKDIRRFLKDDTFSFLTEESGIIRTDNNYLVHSISSETGWKIGILIPFSDIESETNEVIFMVLGYLIAGLILLSVISVFVLNREIIRPLEELTGVSRKIVETGNPDQKITVKSSGEIGILEATFKEMLEKVKTEEREIKEALEGERQAKAELKRARDGLEEEVKARTAELAEANEHLKDLDRLKSMFIASMSHELRTPLNSIIGFTGILLKGWSGEINDEQETQLKIIQSSSKHLLSLINDVIDISKIEAGTVELSLSSFDLVLVLKEIMDSFKEQAEEQGISLKSDLPGRINIYGDERRTKQIVLNLVSNAIKFTDEGTVTLKAEAVDDSAVISVADTGIGILEEKISGLFRPFFRVHTEGRLTEGTGLGLYLSEKIARALGGRITFKSIFGQGSEFTLTIPLRCTEE